MKLTVHVKPNSKHESVEELDDGSLIVKVNAPPTEGKANQRVIKLLSKHFRIPQSEIQLLSGHKGRKKTFLLPSDK